MDPRIREHAEIIARHSVDLQAGDNVIIDAHHVAEDLVVALHEVIGDTEANPLTIQQRTAKRNRRAYLRSHNGTIETPAHEFALIEAADVYLAIRADENVTELSDVSPERTLAFDRAHQPLLEERLSKRWCLTQFPAPANAQLAGMSVDEYETFVWDAINKNWDAQRTHQENLIEILDPGDDLQITSGDTTSISMRIGGNHTINDYGKKNLPGGEVFTAPIPTSVEGEVLFDLPLYHHGREIDDVHLVLEDGIVVEYSAGKNEQLLSEVLNTDDGARRIGELGIGMNRDIDRFTYNMLFDEKMGDTVHMAIGRAYNECVGEGNPANDSAVHVDMILDMSSDSTIEVDGTVIQRDGTFVFENGFEA